MSRRRNGNGNGGRYIVAGRRLASLGQAISYAQARIADGRSDVLDVDELERGTVARVWREAGCVLTKTS